MRMFDVALVNHGVAQGGLYAAMPQKHLYLLDGHALVYGARRQGAPELVRVNPLAQRIAPQLSQSETQRR